MKKQTLLQYLRSVMTEYPKGCEAIAQDGNGNIYFWKTRPVFNAEQDVWESARGANYTSHDLCDENYFLADKDGEVVSEVLCVDYTYSDVSRKEFESGGDNPLDWRDRIIEINEIAKELTLERTELYSKLSKAGFKLDLNYMVK